MPLDDPEIEVRMVKLMLLEMARNECPPEQYQRLGLPEPQRLDKGHSDKQIQLPDEAAMRAACVLRSAKGQQSKHFAGNGFPKMPFQGIAWEGEKTLSEAAFPNNLRLRPGYAFAPSSAPDSASDE